MKDLTFPRYMYNKLGVAVLVADKDGAKDLNPLPPHKQVKEEVKPKRKR